MPHHTRYSPLLVLYRNPHMTGAIMLNYAGAIMRCVAGRLPIDTCSEDTPNCNKLRLTTGSASPPLSCCCALPTTGEWEAHGKWSWPMNASRGRLVWLP